MVVKNQIQALIKIVLPGVLVGAFIVLSSRIPTPSKEPRNREVIPQQIAGRIAKLSDGNGDIVVRLVDQDDFYIFRLVSEYSLEGTKSLLFDVAEAGDSILKPKGSKELTIIHRGVSRRWVLDD